MKIRCNRELVIAAALLLASSLCAAQTGSLRAGAARIDISPTPEMFPLKSAQYSGAAREWWSDFGSVHDPIYSRALVLDNGKAKVAIVAVDILDWNADDNGLSKEIADTANIPVENVILIPSHDDSAIHVGRQNINTPEVALLRKGMIEAVRQANANLQPARIGFGSGKAYVNTNRDQKLGDAYHIGYNPEGPSDRSVPVILVTRPTGEPIAIFTSYAVHSVVMFRARTQDGKVQISSDLAGWTEEYIEAHFPGSVALFAAGAGGDQNPLFMANYNQDGADVHDEGAAGWAILDVESRRLGEEVVRVANAIENTKGQAVLWSARSSVSCPGRKRAPAASGSGAPPQGLPSGPAKMIDGDPVTIPLQLLTVNDIAIAGIAGDANSEIGLRVKKNPIFDRTMMVTLMPNDLGYVPSESAYLLPSQMAANNAIKPGCAEPALISAWTTMENSYLPILKAAAQ